MTEKKKNFLPGSSHTRVYTSKEIERLMFVFRETNEIPEAPRFFFERNQCEYFYSFLSVALVSKSYVCVFFFIFMLCVLYISYIESVCTLVVPVRKSSVTQTLNRGHRGKEAVRPCAQMLVSVYFHRCNRDYLPS